MQLRHKLLGLFCGVSVALVVGGVIYFHEDSTEFNQFFTREELRTRNARAEKVESYLNYLKSLDVHVKSMPFDLLQQEVYHTLHDSNPTYTVTLYAKESEVPTWEDVQYILPSLQYMTVTSETELPRPIKENLSFGYHSILLNNVPYIMEVLYEDVNLSDWEITREALQMLHEKGGNKE